MTLEEKLTVLDALCFADRSGVVSRVDAPSRRRAEQLLRANPRLTIPDLLPRLAIDPPPSIPTI